MTALPEQSPVQSLIGRADNNAASDLKLAEQAVKAGDIAALNTLVSRLVYDRTELAKAFCGIVNGWALLKGESQTTASDDAIASVERIAAQAMTFASEAVAGAREAVAAMRERQLEAQPRKR